MTYPLDMRPLRDFALAVYGREGVQAACLSLQDDHGLDVNVALFAAWAGAAAGLRLDVDDVKRADARVSPWRTQVTGPLRAARRSLKLMEPPWQGQEALRAQVKAAELQSELMELDALEALAGGLGETGRPSVALALANLRTVVTALAGSSAEETEDAVVVIAEACEPFSGVGGLDR